MKVELRDLCGILGGLLLLFLARVVVLLKLRQQIPNATTRVALVRDRLADNKARYKQLESLKRTPRKTK
jgi:hypothetical protein